MHRTSNPRPRTIKLCTSRNRLAASLGLLGLCASLAACGGDFEAQPEPACGNGIIEAGESCDATNLAGNDCTTIGLDFTRGTLGCTARCDGWDTSLCVQGKGAVEGVLSVGAGISCSASDVTTDCQGPAFVLVLEENPATNFVQQPVAMATLGAVDLSEGATASFSIQGIVEGDYYLSGFLDDDGDASAIAPGPDAGDPVGFPALAVTIEADQSTNANVALGVLMP
jgi:hypothetical protein